MAYELNRDDVPQFTERRHEIGGHDWPGNVRELKNVVERAVYRSDDAIITDEEIVFDPFCSPFETTSESPIVRPSQSAAQHSAPAKSGPALESLLEGMSYDNAIHEVESTMLKSALERARFNQRKAADLLGLTYHQFRGLYRKYTDHLGE